MHRKTLDRVLGNIDITKDLVMLLVIGGLYALSIALSNTFVNVYLWKQSGEFMDLALYNLAAVICQPIAFLLAGRLSKKIDRVFVLRIGVAILSLFYFSVLFIGGGSVFKILILGALVGLGLGFYWLAFNVLTFEVTEPDTRDFFNGFLGLLTSFAGMIGPLAAGIIITGMEKSTGYTVIFSVSLVIFVVAVFLSMTLKKRNAKGRFLIRRILEEKKQNRAWSRILNAHFFQGLREGTFVFVIVVWVYTVTNSELALGTYGLVTSATQLIIYYAAGRLIKTKLRKKAILVGGLILYGAIFLLVFNLTFPKLILYGILISIAYPMLLVPYISLTYDVIGKAWNAGEMRVEYMVVRELYLNSGRIVSVLSFILAIQFFTEAYSIPVLLLILGAGHACIYWCVRPIQFNVSKASTSSGVEAQAKEEGGTGGSNA
ncbi:MFS transporter [Alkalicoccobacillus murimartini]|uniref:YQGE family putative transporter n=1 Tax=Alkalicoccobacillus murimartini TaxID=171685 RepID=A0ABT9YCK2_9BACI|nr:MFS transporter [Alkalicoccobacillus murimartini]MDQ0205582.1 YQGE family putative transporter [Alkalicoccobacillus murimartini]